MSDPSALASREANQAMNEKIERPKWMRPGGLLPIDPYSAAQRDDDLARLHDALEERVAALAHAVAQLQSHMIDGNARVSSLTERVAALEAESKKAKCPTCCGDGAINEIEEGSRSFRVVPCPSCSSPDSLPAWQRAKVGDRVKYALVGNKTLTYIAATVANIAEPHNGCRLALGGHGWADNADIICILPPKPRRPEDETDDSDAITSTEAVALWEAEQKLGASTSPQSLDALKYRAAGFTPTEREHLRLCALLDEVYALDRAEQPQRVTVNWNAALDLLYAHGRGPGKSMSDGMLAVLKSIPNLVIEGE